MITVTPLKDLGHFKNDWLEARYHFSFADYRDPARMGWGTLRVWNDDAIQPGGLFPPHPHRDMEIISYVLEGQLEHQDNMGNGSIIRRGEIQKMSAGTGIQHQVVIHFTSAAMRQLPPGIGNQSQAGQVPLDAIR